tara:strand:+ start:274 stop:516 length:243 start_codon:yes stop_codon:yes gene_type:complete
MDIEKVLFPEKDKLKKNKYECTSIIVDEDLDPIKCCFYGDGLVHLDIEQYSEVVLNRKNLNTLRNLLSKADKYYREQESL